MKIQDLLAKADVRISTGPALHPWDIQVRDPRFNKAVLGGTLAMGEAYMKGWWDSGDINELAYRVIKAGAGENIKPWYEPLFNIVGSLLNLQNEYRSKDVIEKHYNLPQTLYDAMLDPETMQYSCAVWEEGVTTLDQAQKLKLHKICQKLDLGKEDTLLDIGCGWGGLSRFAAREYGCRVVGVTLSGSQAKFAKEFCAGLPVEIIVSDYRTMPLSGMSFSKAVSVGMMEHVGPKNFGVYMSVVNRVLTPGGKFLLHTISGGRPRTTSDPFMRKYIFPNGIAPTPDQLLRAARPFFAWNRMENIGPHYYKTTMAWRDRLLGAWPGLISRGEVREEVLRMFIFYLGIAGANFRARRNDVIQIEFTKI